MSVFSYVVIAGARTATALCDAPAPLDAFRGYGEKMFDPARWGTLATVVGFDPADSSRLAATAPLAASDPDEGPWVFEIPRSLLERVAELDERSIAVAAEAWVATDRLLATAGLDYARDVLTRFASIAARAIATRESVLVRVDL